MTRHSPTIRPEWATRHDRAVDATDVWQEATDPFNEYGEVCTAYLRKTDRDCVDERARCFTGAGFELVGLGIESRGTVIYCDRLQAMTFIGTDGVWRIEASEMEAA